MSASPLPATDEPATSDVLARAAAADVRVDARLATAIADIFLPERDRLDERTRAAVARLVEATVAAAERDIAGHAARVLATRGHGVTAQRLSANHPLTLPRLATAGLLRDADIMAEMIAQARIDLIDEALVTNRAPGTRATLLARLTESRDGVIRSRAVTYLVADSRRRGPAAARRAELPAALHQRLAWWIAAALREHLAAAADGAVDRALVEATQRSLDAQVDCDRVAMLAVNLAAAIAPDAGDLPRLLLDTLVEGRLALFVAVLAQAVGIDPVEARGLVLDTDSERLWLALRGVGLSREEIAQLGWLLSEADGWRDAEALADVLGPIAALAPDMAAQVVAPLTLDRDYRAAIRALARTQP
ncbi:DUF2336 domain-containing protein [Sphingomonas adhaesiva]|uniref:DUF2336 domain-containing protein n=1 Tax=Sphingomonas adhaesiva TaxID=28212 RepID=UPI002FF6C69E